VLLRANTVRLQAAAASNEKAGVLLSSGPEHKVLTNTPVIVTQSDLNVIDLLTVAA
jgi:hypothetical protein